MKHIKSLLEFTAFLQVIFAIYGICGAYEQNYIDGLQLAEYLLVFCMTLTTNIIGIKALTAAIRLKNRKFTKSDNNRTNLHSYDSTKL
ncbi:MAG: hypothetical protein OSJ54_13340 [Oscillospiraceae bacterium]|nr:hypothetical protein [Oscillospiraceae bacterium]